MGWIPGNSTEPGRSQYQQMEVTRQSGRWNKVRLPRRFSCPGLGATGCDRGLLQLLQRADREPGVIRFF